jgi:hypothetical protein
MTSVIWKLPASWRASENKITDLIELSRYSMPKIMLIAMLLSLSNNIAAQIYKPVPKAPRFTLKVNGPALINPVKAAVAFSSDIRVAKRYSVDAGVGWFYNSETFSYYVGESFRGPRLRLGLKRYRGDAEEPGYIGLEAKWNHAYNKAYTTVLRQGDQYSERMLLDLTRSNAGLSLRLGKHISLFGSWFVDFYMGAGIVANRNMREPLPTDARVLDDTVSNPFENFNGKTYLLPDVLIGFHIGYEWKKDRVWL